MRGARRWTALSLRITSAVVLLAVGGLLINASRTAGGDSAQTVELLLGGLAACAGLVFARCLIRV